MLGWLRRVLTAAVVFGLIALNLVTLTSATAMNVAAGLLSQIGVPSAVAEVLDERDAAKRKQAKLEKDHTRLKKDHEAAKTKNAKLIRDAANAKSRVKKTANRIVRRMTTNAGRNVAATWLESIPIYGIGVIAGVTALELMDACDTAKDMAELQRALGVEEDAPQGTVCSISVPKPDDLMRGIFLSNGEKQERCREVTKFGVDTPDCERIPAASRANGTVVIDLPPKPPGNPVVRPPDDDPPPPPPE